MFKKVKYNMGYEHYNIIEKSSQDRISIIKMH